MSNPYTPDHYGDAPVRDRNSGTRPGTSPVALLSENVGPFLDAAPGLRTASGLVYLVPDDAPDERVSLTDSGAVRLNAPACRAVGATVGDTIRATKCAGRWLRLDVINGGGE